MSSPPGGTIRKRKDASIPVKSKDAAATGLAARRDPDLDALVKAKMENKRTGVDWD
jgi:dolichyl-phosphate-mannose-protein mannosyltransferase